MRRFGVVHIQDLDFVFTALFGFNRNFAGTIFGLLPHQDFPGNQIPAAIMLVDFQAQSAQKKGADQEYGNNGPHVRML